ncbi:MAG: glycoside hydrolase family 26 protein [Candidatus Symbiothrix sp.]|nr:glycoside hydrolase family 26 protein [Candidatus Symbiothrix sp.]
MKYKSLLVLILPFFFTCADSNGETPAPPVPPVPPATPVYDALCVKNPSTQAVNLYNFLKESYGQKIIAGTMANVDWNTNEADWVYKHTGKYPALTGFDYMHIYGNFVDYGNTTVMENWWNNKGIVTACWHWNVPRSQGNANYAFYTSPHLENNVDTGTTFDISKAVQEGTAENTIVKADLKKVADKLLLLKNKNIPVLWRPLHEAAGGWFWWGAKGPESCKALWKMMFNYFQECGLNNLIWIWTAEPKDIAGGQNAWYPGDQYVDIIGRDIYNQTSASQLYNNEYKVLQTRYPNKLITLSECGNVAGITEQWNAGATWSWFMPWYDYNRTNNPTGSNFNSQEHQYMTIAAWKAAFNNEKVISRDKMPSLK